MKTFIITDTHFNHQKLVELCGRPQNHTELIGGNLLKMNFTEQDILIHLGDVCIGRDAEAHDKYIKPLKCKKWLVLGNHDRKSRNWYLNHGWDWVGYQFSDSFFGKKILFSHIPLSNWESNGFDFNIHGHFHNNDHHPELRNTDGKHLLLAIENTFYKPILLETFLTNYNRLFLAKV